MEKHDTSDVPMLSGDQFYSLVLPCNVSMSNIGARNESKFQLQQLLNIQPHSTSMSILALLSRLYGNDERSSYQTAISVPIYKQIT